MAFRRSDLQEAFFVPGTHAFRVWGYGTADPLEEVLAPNYFNAAGELRPGELIYVSTTPGPGHAGGGGDGGGGPRPGDGAARWTRCGLGSPGPGLRSSRRSTRHAQLLRAVIASDLRGDAAGA